MPRKPKNAPLVCEFFTWRIIVRDGVHYADGRGGKFNLGKHSLGSRDRDEAIEALKQLDRKKAVELGLTEATLADATADLSIAEGWKLFLDFTGRADAMGGAAASTVDRYRPVGDDHTEFCRRHGIANWSEFNKSALVRYGNYLDKKHAYATVYFEVTLLKSVTKWLTNEGLLPPGSELKYPMRKPQGTDTYCYTTAEVSAMVSHCKASPKLTWLAHVIIALAHTGMRISELTGLRWCDINLQQKTITVADERASRRKRQAGTARTTKGRRSRTLPIHPVLAQLLQTHARQADGYVFHALRGGKLLARNVLQTLIDKVVEPLKKRFPTAKDDHGFEHGRLHSFRHFFCSQCFLGGASEGEIRQWLGHADTKMVEHYRHLRNEDAQKKMNQIKFLDPPESSPGAVA
jgi:integrase